MGGGSYSSKDWSTYSSTRRLDSAATRVDDIFKARSVYPAFDPKQFKFRESVDSADNPESTPIILGVDVTGSMGPVIEALMKKSLPTACKEIFDRGSVTGAHLCSLALGDAVCDSAPLQATQFEADIRIAEQLENLWLEGRGGGNEGESYMLAWYFALFRTKTDSFAKRGKKGFIFTFGDEPVLKTLTAEQIKRHLGDDVERDFTSKELFEMVSDQWNVYHIVIMQGQCGQSPTTKRVWEETIGSQRMAMLEDYTKLGETITAILELHKGTDLKDVTSSWDGSTAVVVKNALKDVVIHDDSSKTLDAVL